RKSNQRNFVYAAETGVGRPSSVSRRPHLIRALPGYSRAYSFQVRLLLHWSHNSKPNRDRFGVPPDALRRLRVPLAPFLSRSSARRTAKHGRLIVPRAAAHHLRISLRAG